MSVQEKYTEEEWFLLQTTPSMVGSAMAVAGNSGIMGTMKEAMANVRSIMEANAEYPDNPLIAEVAKKPENRADAKEMASDYRERIMGRMKENGVKEPEEVAALTLSDVEQSCAILAAKEDDATALEYKNWLLAIANKVAEAAKEGGFLGFGGEQVSENEQAFLAQLNSALNMDEIV